MSQAIDSPEGPAGVDQGLSELGDLFIHGMLSLKVDFHLLKVSTQIGWKLSAIETGTQIGFHLNRMETQEGLQGWAESWDWTEIERFSLRVFGSSHRLSVLLLAADAEPKRLYVEAIAKCIGVGTRTEKAATKELGRFAREQLRDLKDAALLRDNHRPPRRPKGLNGRTPTTYLARTDDHFWECLQELGDRFRKIPRRTGNQSRVSPSK